MRFSGDLTRIFGCALSLADEGSGARVYLACQQILAWWKIRFNLNVPNSYRMVISFDGPRNIHSATGSAADHKPRRICIRLARAMAEAASISEVAIEAQSLAFNRR